MDNVLGIDLAARNSAGIVLRDGGLTSHGEVLDDIDSLNLPPVAFCMGVVALAAKHDVDLIAVEDVPYGISSQAMVKPVLRLQGILIACLAQEGLLDRTVFVNPATWQRAVGVYGKAKTGARDLARSFGYEPPDLLALHASDINRLHGKERTRLRDRLKKATTDYDDAFLLTYWAALHLGDIRRIPGVQEPMI